MTLFLIPDKVWAGLGLTTEWLCLSCVAHRLNPAITVDELSAEIHKQSARFHLKRRAFNSYGRVQAGQRGTSVQMFVPNDLATCADEEDDPIDMTSTTDLRAIIKRVQAGSMSWKELTSLPSWLLGLAVVVVFL